VAPPYPPVSCLAFDGMILAAGTHQGYVHTWKLMEHEGKRGYVRLLNPLRVAGQGRGPGEREGPELTATTNTYSPSSPR